MTIELEESLINVTVINNTKAKRRLIIYFKFK